MAVGEDLAAVGVPVLVGVGVGYYIDNNVDDPRYRRNRIFLLPLASLVAFYVVGTTVRDGVF